MRKKKNDRSYHFASHYRLGQVQALNSYLQWFAERGRAEKNETKIGTVYVSHQPNTGSISAKARYVTYLVHGICGEHDCGGGDKT